jgi:uncharacterized protein (TIGR03083 family)
MVPRSRKARVHDPASTRAALLAQARALREAVRGLTAERYAAPTRLGSWTVRELVVHIARETESMTRMIGEEPPAGRPSLTLSGWARSTAAIADLLDEDTRGASAESADPAARLDDAVAGLERALADGIPDRVVNITLGTMSAADFAVTRIVELVVHADDLRDATGAEVPLDRQALAAATRLLADAFADKVPGNTVELRIPPFAAVQCVEGPRHTRGTPPNVVETDPLSWLRLATGRTGWAAALEAAQLSASGERADLSRYLPVLA